MAASRFGQLLKDVATPALTSGSLAGGFALLGGANPLQALASAATDAVASGASVGLLRTLSPKSYAKRTLIDPRTKEKVVQQGSHPLEGWLNFGTSVGTGYLMNPIIYGTGAIENQVMPTDTVQAQQILQENIQRDLLNTRLAGKYALPNAYSPGTMFQMQGLESTIPGALTQRENMYEMPGANLASLQRDMGAIVGV